MVNKRSELAAAFEDAWDEEFAEMIAEGSLPGDSADLAHWLQTAIGARNPKMVAWILTKGADPNDIDETGFWPLKCALQVEGECGRNAEAAADLTISLIDLLLAAGADINSAGTLDETTLHRAAMWSSPKVVQRLLAAGADPLAWDSEYTPRQPIYYAKFHKRPDVAAVLQEARDRAPHLDVPDAEKAPGYAVKITYRRPDKH